MPQPVEGLDVAAVRADDLGLATRRSCGKSTNTASSLNECELVARERLVCSRRCFGRPTTSMDGPTAAVSCRNRVVARDTIREVELKNGSVVTVKRVQGCSTSSAATARPCRTSTFNTLTATLRPMLGLKNFGNALGLPGAAASRKKDGGVCRFCDPFWEGLAFGFYDHFNRRIHRKHHRYRYRYRYLGRRVVRPPLERARSPDVSALYPRTRTQLLMRPVFASVSRTLDMESNRVRKAIDSFRGAPFTLRQIADRLTNDYSDSDISRKNIEQTVRRSMKGGILQRVGRGTYRLRVPNDVVCRPVFDNVPRTMNVGSHRVRKVIDGFNGGPFTINQVAERLTKVYVYVSRNNIQQTIRRMVKVTGELQRVSRGTYQIRAPLFASSLNTKARGASTTPND
jgi:hypothetical protein